MARFAAWLLFVFAFAVPWEYSLDFGEPVGNIARVASVLLLGIMTVAVLLRGGMKRFGVVLWLVAALYLYFAASYFWTIDTVASLEKMRAYLQVMAATWLVWEVAQDAKDLRGLMRALVGGCGVLAVLTVLDFAGSGGLVGQARFVAAGRIRMMWRGFWILGFRLGCCCLRPKSAGGGSYWGLATCRWG